MEGRGDSRQGALPAGRYLPLGNGTSRHLVSVFWALVILCPLVGSASDFGHITSSPPALALTLLGSDRPISCCEGAKTKLSTAVENWSAGIHMDVGVCAYACRGWGLCWVFFSVAFSILLFETGCSLNLELPDF